MLVTKDKSTERATAAIQLLASDLEDGQILLALIANDPTNPENGNLAAAHFSRVNATLAAVRRHFPGR